MPNSALQGEDPETIPGFIGPASEAHLHRYRYDQYLSHGAVGSAWRIQRNSDDEVFALKITRLDKLSPERAMRTEIEITCLESVKHFACIRLYEKYHSQTSLFLVMEYCDAGDLHYQLKQLRAQRTITSEMINGDPAVFPQVGMEEYHIKFILLQLVLGLHYLHVHRKILHRDLKPANVLMTTYGLVKIGDFGLSNSYETVSGDVGRTICGTPLYVAPELWQHKHYGRAADMWSLGILLYECMTGQVPFSGARLETLQRHVLSDEPPPITGVYSPGLHNIVAQLLRKNPTERPDSCALLQEPYLKEALGEMQSVLLASRVPPAMMSSIETDVQKQLEHIPQYVIDRNLRFEGEVEKFKSPHERRYLVLADGMLTIERSRNHAQHRACQNNSRSSSAAVPSGGAPPATSKSAIALASIANVVSLNSLSCLALRFENSNFILYRTSQADEWQQALRRGLGWPPLSSAVPNAVQNGPAVSPPSYIVNTPNGPVPNKK